MNEEIYLFSLKTIQWVRYLAQQVSKVCNLEWLLINRHKLLRMSPFEQGVEERTTSFYVVNFCKALEFKTTKIWLKIDRKLECYRLFCRNWLLGSKSFSLLRLAQMASISISYAHYWVAIRDFKLLTPAVLNILLPKLLLFVS
jgi:hypothetical protein